MEIDETCFTHRKYQIGRIVTNLWVFGGVCRETGDVFILPVPNRKATTLLPLIEKHIAPGSKIMSDCFSAYDKIE